MMKKNHDKARGAKANIFIIGESLMFSFLASSSLFKWPLVTLSCLNLKYLSMFS